MVGLGGMMTFITVEVNTRERSTILRALKKVRGRVTFWKSELPRRWSIDYSQQLVSNILSQKFAGFWSPYNERYADWKLQNYPAGKFWKLSGDLVQLITSTSGKKVYEGPLVSKFFAGVPRGPRESTRKSYGGKGRVREIYYYAMIMEYGKHARGQHHPARPLIRPTYRQVAPKYKGQAGLVAVDIGKRWK